MSDNMHRNFRILSWALYDLANQFFALNVVSLYFPLWLTKEKGTHELFYGLSFGASMFFVAVCAPILGAVSDIRARYKDLLIYCTLISVLFTMALGISGNLFLVLLFFAVANFGCQEAVIFYNALMVKVAPQGRIGLISGLGRMFGYTGAITALLLSKPVVAKFGYQAIFFLTGILFLVFSLPCMIFIREKPSGVKMRVVDSLKKDRIIPIFGRLRSTIFDSRKFPGLRDFLKASFFGLGAVNTIILFMSVYVNKVFGLTEAQIANLIVFSTLFAILGSILSGLISDAIGYKRSMVGVFFLWIACLMAAGLLSKSFCLLIGALAGISLGATWVVSRALVIRLVPTEEIGEVFGIFNLVVYSSAIVGPLFWTSLLLFLSNWGPFGYRIALLSLILFMVFGLVFLLRVPAGSLKK